MDIPTHTLGLHRRHRVLSGHELLDAEFVHTIAPTQDALLPFAVLFVFLALPKHHALSAWLLLVDRRMFSSLALGGGGVRGGLHVGALVALERVRGNLQFQDGIYGCSVGSILATAVAFNLTSQQIQTMFDTYFDLQRFVPPLRLTSLTDLSVKKGLFSMDMLESTLIEAFQSQAIDLRNKLISDAPQPLYIVASNMTTYTTTVFSGTVPILDAIKCSSCLPMVFAPQILYNQVYLDGGILIDSLESIAPTDCLTLHISAPRETIFPNELSDMTLTSYLHRVYRGMRTKPPTRNMLWLHNSTIGLLQELTPADKALLVEQGTSQTLAFLAKRFPQEFEKSVDTSLSVKLR